MFTKINDIVRSFYYGIKNLKKWFPIIWKDRDWDYFYLYKILKFKLERMEYLQRKYGYAVDSNKIADQIKLCINLLDRILKDEYSDMVFKKHDKKWGKLQMVFKPLEDNPNFSELLKRENVITEEDKKQERKEFAKLIQIEDNLKKQDIDLLFDTMKKYSQRWWD